MGKLILREKKTLWSASAYAIPEFGDQAHVWFKNDNTLAVESTNILSSFWLGPIETKGADRLFVQWGGLLGAQTGGGMDAVVACPGYVYALGLPYYDPSEAIFAQPPVAREATIAQATFDEYSTGVYLQCYGNSATAVTTIPAIGGAGGPVATNIMYIPDGTDAATGDYTASFFEVSNRVVVQSTASSVTGIRPSIAGIAAVWLAIKIVPDFTDNGSTVGTLTSGKWLALLYDEIPEVRQSQVRTNTRRDLMVGNVPVSP